MDDRQRQRAEQFLHDHFAATTATRCPLCDGTGTRRVIIEYGTRIDGEAIVACSCDAGERYAETVIETTGRIVR